MRNDVLRACVVGGVAALTMVAGGVSAQMAYHPHVHGDEDHDGLPGFDIRESIDGVLSDQATAALAEWRGTGAYSAKVAALHRLKMQVPDLRCDDHPVFGTPLFLRSTAAFLTPASKAPYADILAGYLDANADLFGFDSKALGETRVVRNFDTHGIMHHLTHQQVVGGLDVFGATMRSNFTTRGELINVSCSFVPTPVGGWNIVAPVLTAEAALRTAAASVGVPIVNPVTPGEAVDGKTAWAVGDELDHWTPTTTRRVMFAVSRDEVRPAFHVVIPTKGIGHTYDVVIDAVDGKVLHRNNWLRNDTTQPVTYRIFTGDSPAPWSPGPTTNVSTQAPFVPRALMTINPIDVAPYSPNGWIPDGGTTTTGNNVDAYLDRDATANSPDVNGRPVSATRVFDDAIAVDAGNMPTGAPTTYSMASVAHGFYHTNRYHDIMYAMGFTEGAANFQADNFGLGGVAGDRVLLEMQDGSGTNNANFSFSAADGSVGRCQMYLFTGPTPDRDGGLDQDILYHELTHGTSQRCHESTLGSTQAGGMGEGWSDFYGICLNAQPGDDFNAVYATGGHTTYLLSATFTTNYYFGIRRFPYSTDMTKSPLTYGDIVAVTYDTAIPRSTVIGNTAGEVHNVGEIWCQTLLEARANIGIDEGAAANQTIMQLVLDGMKLAPSAPTFLTERDAILQADLVRYSGQHQLRLWQGFAKRGMGSSAVSPASGSTTGVVEAFDLPNRADFTFPDGTPTQIAPNVATNFRVHLTPILLTLTPNSGQMFLSVDGAPFAPITMTPNGADEYIATIPPQSCFAGLRYYFQVGTSMGTQVNPATAPASTYAAAVYTGTTEVLYNDMETDAGWTVGPNTATTGIWNRMAPQATAAQPGADTTPAPGVNCWVTNGVAGASVGANDVDGGYTYLNSPTFDCSGVGDEVIEFQRWYSNASTATPPATYGNTWLVQISNNNGSTWSTFETLPAGSAHQQGWFLVSRSLSQLGVAGTNQMKLRFRAEDAVGAFVEAAIDDMRVYSSTCVGGPACDAIDFNGDGLYPDTADIDDFLSVFSGGPCSTGTCGDVDFNNDGLFPDTLDIDSLLSVFSGGPCL